MSYINVYDIFKHKRNDVSATNNPLPEAEVRNANKEEDVRRCWLVFQELRPHLTEEEFVKRWKTQREEGYEIIYIQIDGEVVAAAGFRVMKTMAWGKILYLDDLIALGTQHGRGWGTILLIWLKKKALTQQCDGMHLDTGYQRHAAHKAYLRNGFELNCHHLSWKAN